MSELHAANEKPYLSISGLTVDISTPSGPVRVLRDVDLTVNKGEIVGIVGESGSGKSMTALSIMQLLPVGGTISAGSIVLGGEELVGASPQRLREVRGRTVGMIFQDPMTTLDPVMTVGRQIGEAYRIHHPRAKGEEIRDRVIEKLRLVGVPEPEVRMKQYPHQWSGGMRQRAVIAMSLINDPELIIADEPTTALDATVQAQVLDVLVRARDELNVSIILVTHDLGILAQIASRVAVMYAGSVVEVAGMRQIFEDSRHPYSEALITSRPGTTARGEALTTIPGRPPAMAALPPGCPFEPRCQYPGKNSTCVEIRPLLEMSSDGRPSACHFREERRLSA